MCVGESNVLATSRAHVSAISSEDNWDSKWPQCVVDPRFQFLAMDDVADLNSCPGTRVRVLLKKKFKKKRVFACGEAASQTEVPVRRSRAGTESDHNCANTTSFQGGSYFLLLYYL